MYLEDQSYRPARIEFTAVPDETGMPESLGTFEKEEDLKKFIANNMIAINQGITVNRFMDQKEKQMVRSRYTEILETKLPNLRTEHYEARMKLQEAKENEKKKAEAVNVTLEEVEEYSRQVRIGKREMDLDELYTYKIPLRDKYYYYTWIDHEFRLVRVREIPLSERNDLYNQMHRNEGFIEKLTGVKLPEREESSDTDDLQPNEEF